MMKFLAPRSIPESRQNLTPEVATISLGVSLALASEIFVLKSPCFFYAIFLYLTVLVLFSFFSDDEGLSAKDAPDIGTANTGASKTLTASDAVKDSAPATGTSKETTVPKKRAKKNNADKGVVIISDNPSGPPLDDVSFLCVLSLLLLL